MVLPPENVWNYPRPAICEPTNERLKVVLGEHTIAETSRGFRTLETSHPPTYYFPIEDVNMVLLSKNQRHSLCEWKGQAHYYDSHLDDRVVRDIAWAYSNPTHGFLPIKDCISFYASKVDSCFVNDEEVSAQEGDFYGGWITGNLQGPFKGGAGTMGW